MAALLSTGTTARAAPARPRLVLFVSVDQMRADYLDRFGHLFTGGFRRILDRGATFTQALYRHSSTQTGPGHALLLSGRHPRDHGIVANEWYDRTLRKVVNVVEDASVRPLGGPGKPRSPVHFVGLTVGDRLKAASPGSKVVGVAMKDRSAILMAGPRADAAYWYDSTVGRFITSSHYTDEAPAWLDAWNRSGRVDGLFGRTWTRLLPDTAVYERLAGPDAAEGERGGRDAVFPHAIRGKAGTEAFHDDLRGTPFADELVLEVALAALEGHGLGTDTPTDILAVGFSATDTIGHAYGPDSQEVMDQLLRLDRILAALIDAVETRVGRDGYLLVLGADHGVMPLVERSLAEGRPARRVRPEALEGPVRAALAAAFPGGSDLIAAYDDPHFWLDLQAIAGQGLQRAQVEAVIERAALATGLVARVYTPSRLLGDPPPDDPDFALFRNAFFEPRSPHLVVRLRPWVSMEDDADGAAHGSAERYDRHVAMAFLGRGIRPGRYDAPCGPEEIAPTLAGLLGLEYPLEDGQRVLSEMSGEMNRASEVSGQGQRR